MTYSSIGVTL